jgi:hypothetical protein
MTGRWRKYLPCLAASAALVIAWIVRGRWRVTLVLIAALALCAATGFISRREWVRSALLALASVLITLVAFEVYLRATTTPYDLRVSYQDSYRAVKRPLGRGPAGPGQYRSSTVTRTTGQSIYDVVYSIGPHGFRSTRGGGPGADTYLFFGGSYTFGEGVDDDETYPARFSEALEFASTVVNISFEGYGPHQMLRALELGLPDQAITGEVRRVFYLALWGHTNRAAGLYWWNIFSPRYVLDERGDLISAGFFRQDWRWRLLAALDKQGGLTELLGEGIQSVLLPIDDRVRLTGAVIERASRISKERYGARFVCLLWDDQRNGARIASLERELQSRGVETLRASRLIGSLGRAEHRILPGVEDHPNGLAYRALGYKLAALVRSEDRAAATPLPDESGGR